MTYITKKFLLTFLFFIVFRQFAIAQVPANYYQSAQGKSNQELKTALHMIIEKGTRLSYGSGSGKTWSGFEQADRHPQGHVWDMYSNTKRYFPGNGGVPSGMNIEHSVAKSWWGGTNNDAYKDLYHLNPSEITANSARSNYPLGKNNGSQFNNGSIKVGNNTYMTEYNGLCFEPLDEYKGDFARAYLYMFTCYEDFTWTGTSAPSMIVANQKWPMLRNWAKNLLVEWHRNDPVSQKELDRMAAIYSIQNNRNPFIDYPELVEHLWGNKVNVPWNIADLNAPYLSLPVAYSNIDFAKTPYNERKTIDVAIKAHNLQGGLSLNIVGPDAQYFSLASTSISKNDALAGKTLAISVQSSKLGALAATLQISSEGMTSMTYNIVANISNDLIAVGATNIRNNAFTANWSQTISNKNYLLHVYSFEESDNTESVTLLEEDFNPQPGAWSTTGFTENQTQSLVRLGSGSSNGSITSPEIELEDTPLLITAKAKRYSNDANAELILLMNDTEIHRWVTTSTVETYTFSVEPEDAKATFGFAAKSGKRVYLDYVKIATEQKAAKKQDVVGFPLLVNNINSLTINNLDSDKQYFYYIVAADNSSEPSNVVSVRTNIASSTNENVFGNTIVYTHNRSLQIKHLINNTLVEVYNINGQKLYAATSAGSEHTVAISPSGVYLVKLSHANFNRTIKVVL